MPGSCPLLDLPEDVGRQIGLNLDAPDVLALLSSHRRFHKGLGQSDAFWSLLYQRDSCHLPISNSQKSNNEHKDPPSFCTTISRRDYLTQAYRKHLPAVKWYPILQSQNPRSPRLASRLTIRHAGVVSAREGHLSCVLSTSTEDRICIQGGFCDDPNLHILHAPRSSSATGTPPWTWNHVAPAGPLTFVYGASLTALDGNRAVRFGGFQSGGYSGETNDVTLLTLKDDLTAQWEYKTPTIGNPQFVAAARAYHTATLLAGRYLLILGGMTFRESILSEAILDTQKWTWLDPSRIILNSLTMIDPSGRHGHSVILDSRRNRLVLFGGGDGTDLLRSGRDNADVWELKMGEGWESNLEASFPWTWHVIHGDDYFSVVYDDVSPLSSAEKLCLGRCHNAIKVGPDTALLLFGSGRPSTNGIIAYDLSTDSFMRPKVEGPLPTPRFTFVSAFLEKQGYLVVHGGFTSQLGGALGDMHVLDLAPLLQNRAFINLPIDREARCYGPILNHQVRGVETRSDASLNILQILEDLTNEERGTWLGRW